MNARHSAAPLIVLFLLLTSTSAAAVTIPWETRTGHNRSGATGWTYSYDIGVFNDVLMVDVDIALAGVDPGASLRTRWECGIEGIWSTDRFSVPIVFNVDWVGLTSSHDQRVTVRSGPGFWNLRTWYITDAGDWGDSYHEEFAAHEYGHMISLWDEYEGAAVDPLTGRVNTGGLMDTLDGSTLDYYYAPFLTWYEERRAALGIPEPRTIIPEPGTIMLLGVGVVALVLVRLRRLRAPAGSAPRKSRLPIGAQGRWKL